MKKITSFVLLISIALVILLIYGCEQKIAKQTTPTTTQGATEDTAGTETTQITIPSRVETWFETTCKDECKEDNGCFNQCMNKNAFIEQDSSLCEPITSDIFREGCKNNVLVKRATTSNDINICGQITDDNIKQICKNQFSS